MSHFILTSINIDQRLHEAFSKIYQYIYCHFDRNRNNNSFANTSFRQPDRHSIRPPCKRKLLDSIRNRSGGDRRFFIYFLQKREHIEDTREGAISSHSTILAQKLKQSKSEQLDITWKKFLSDFRYGKEFKQHLKTGHSELYSHLVLLIVNEQNEIEIYDTRYDKIKSRINSELGKIGVTDNMKANEPRLYIPEIVNHILRVIDIKDWKGFQFKRNETGSRCLAINSETFQIFGFDQPRADKPVEVLNSIFKDSQLLKDIQVYQEIRDELKSKRKLFEEQLDELLKGIDSSTKRFKGVCDQCVDMQGINYTANLRKELSDLI